MKLKHKRYLRRAALIYPAMAIVLLPWTFYLSQSLPAYNITLHWDVSWIGLNVILIVLLTATGILSYMQSRWVVISATILGSFLLLDAWFDVLAARGGDDFRQAVVLAILVEIPVALASFYIAGHALTAEGACQQPLAKIRRTRRR